MTTRDNADKISIPLYAAIHPTFFIALVLLLANDHFLKWWSPSWLTGKLSDFAGLYVFAVVLACLFRRWLTNEKRLAILHVGVALAFAIWKLAPLQPLLEYINAAVSSVQITRTPDPTDLPALVVLPVSYMMLRRKAGSGPFSLRVPFRRLGAVLALATAGFAIIATTPIPYYVVTRDLETSRIRELPAEMLFKIEETLVNCGATVEQRWNDGCNGYVFVVSFDTTVTTVQANGKTKSEHLAFRGRIVVSANDSDSGLFKVHLTLTSNKHLFRSKPEVLARIDSLVSDRIMKPLEERLHK